MELSHLSWVGWSAKETRTRKQPVSGPFHPSRISLEITLDLNRSLRRQKSVSIGIWYITKLSYMYWYLSNTRLIKPEKNRQLVRTRYRINDNIRADLK